MKKGLRKSVELYQEFRGEKPRKVARVPYPVPRSACALGHLEYVGYRTTHNGKLVLYQHDFAAGSRPVLASSPDGKQLLLLGGRYKFGARGIVDIGPDGREVVERGKGKPIRNPLPRKKRAKSRNARTVPKKIMLVR